MKSIVTYDKSAKTISCEDQSIIPEFCKRCINNPQKKCADFYENLLSGDKEGLYTCPYKFGTYYARNNIYTSLIIKNDNYSKVKKSIESCNQKINKFPQYSTDEIHRLINDFDELFMDNIILRDCMHDLRNIGSFFNAMSKEVEDNYPELIDDKVVKALISLYDLVNYRINILNGTRSSDNRRVKQKMYPLISKLSIMLSYQARKKDLKFNIDSHQEKYVELSNNIYLAMFILLENAVKHSISENDINICFDEKEDCLDVIIENIGAKIDEDEIDNLTIRGYRGRNTTTKGTGVGLSLAKEIFDAHNCSFKIEIINIDDYKSIFKVTVSFAYSK